MKKYAQIIDHETKLCNVGVGTNTDFYKSIGMELLDVEQAYDGNWYLKGYAPLKPFDELKAEKLSELTSLCHNFDDRLVNNDMYVISSLGFKVNADIRSQNNLKGLIAVNADTVNFVDYNNEIHKLKASDLNTLLVEVSKNGENLYMQKWAYAEKINACKTIAELEKITFDFVMLDFSKE